MPVTARCALCATVPAASYLRSSNRSSSPLLLCVFAVVAFVALVVVGDAAADFVALAAVDVFVVDTFAVVAFGIVDGTG